MSVLDDRGGPMAGELTEPLAGLIAALLLERFCDPLVQPGATGTPEILIQRVLDERMGEREALGSLGALLQQRRRDRLIEQVEQPRLGKLEHREQQIEIEVTADDRGGAERRAGVRTQALHPPPDHLADALRQAQLGQVAQPGASARPPVARSPRTPSR